MTMLTLSQPVTLTLRKGDPNDLETIEILADGVRGSSYEWEVDDDLDSGKSVELSKNTDTGG